MIRKFNEFNENEWVEKSEPMISRGSVSIYDFVSYDSFKSFVMDNKDIFQNVKWAINPAFRGVSETEHIFNLYLRKYPNFYVIIDYDKKNVFGLALGKNELLCCDKDGYDSDIKPYLDKLHLSLEELK